MTSDGNFERAWEVLREGVAAHAFPGAAAAIIVGNDQFGGAVGRLTYEEESAYVSHDTIYDLASLTKVAATTSMAMALYERGALALETPACEFVPEFPHARVTLRHLLEHSSGLPAYAKLYERTSGKDEMVRAACALSPEAEPGTRAEYSDIGFIVLGAALERIAGMTLDVFCARELFAPAGMRKACFNPAAEIRCWIPPTEIDREYRHRVVQGEVHDENASAMGGVAGHAGLFGSAIDVAAFARALLGDSLFKGGTTELFTRRASSPAGTSRALGWDTPSPPSQSGKYFGPRSFGHLGFTGTSLWIDPDRDLAIVLLTNRTWPDRQSQLIKQIRPRFHDAVIEALR